jgi:excisionase family DNA binding protein
MHTRNSCLRAPVSTVDDLVSVVESRQAAWTVEEFARLLKTSTKYIYKQVRYGMLPAYKVGSMLRLDPKTTASWLRSRMTVPAVQREVAHG